MPRRAAEVALVVTCALLPLAHCGFIRGHLRREVQASAVGLDAPCGSEVGVLQDVHAALGGASWRDASGWLTGDHCSWYGVVCQDGHVTYVRGPTGSPGRGYGRAWAGWPIHADK